ncbi:MAG: response regulator [Candidatus Eisenbacteria bacterium]|uniref:Response regulator n=1 Tax=Eiseniibacteriota bacterium TaxID=2212470 RepID=A0A956NB67_UNCEI|nr:response regulator [Candidatus Eisenbacteria bacterium]
MNERRPLVLCVDDDPDVLTYLQVVLESEGFGFASADSAEEGLIAFRRVHPDILIIDMMMEEVDAGTDLVRDLRAEGNEAPVFMLSSVGDNLSYTLDANALGLAGVFQKPLRKEQLLSVLRAKVGRS